MFSIQNFLNFMYSPDIFCNIFLIWNLHFFCFYSVTEQMMNCELFFGSYSYLVFTLILLIHISCANYLVSLEYFLRM
jgi:hypothetical protein